MSIQSEYRLVPGAPTADEYLKLRSESGLSPKNHEQAQGALAGSWSFCRVVASDGTAVAMGRVIGDGGWYFHIADMATLPEHQGRGLGRRVLDHLIEDIRQRAPANPYITLLADAPGRRLYLAAGFQETAPDCLGMVLPNPA